MKTNIILKSPVVQTQNYKRTKKYNFFQRFSPFVILAPALIVLCPFIVAGAEANTKDQIIKVIVLPFIIANSVYIDFALRKYYRSKKRGLIWIIESIISGFIIYWIV